MRVKCLLIIKMCIVKRQELLSLPDLFSPSQGQIRFKIFVRWPNCITKFWCTIRLLIYTSCHILK